MQPDASNSHQGKSFGFNRKGDWHALYNCFINDSSFLWTQNKYDSVTSSPREFQIVFDCLLNLIKHHRALYFCTLMGGRARSWSKCQAWKRWGSITEWPNSWSSAQCTRLRWRQNYVVLTVGSHLEDCSHRLEKLENGANSRSGRFHNGQNGSGTKWRQLAPIIFTSIQLLHNLNFFFDIAKLIEKVRKPSLQAFRPPYNKKLPIWQKSAQNTRASGYPPNGQCPFEQTTFQKGASLTRLLALHCGEFLSQWLKMFGVEVLQLRCYKLLFPADGVNYAQFIPPLKAEQPRAA